MFKHFIGKPNLEFLELLKILGVLNHFNSQSL